MRSSFSVGQLEYELPQELIAQSPPANRGDSRMLVLDRATGHLSDRRISDLPDFLRAGDALVVNDSRVLPARFMLQRETGGQVEGLFLREVNPDRWEVMLKGGQRLDVGQRLSFVADEMSLGAILVEKLDRGRWILKPESDRSAADILEQIGRMPLPPYIKRDKQMDPRDADDRRRYQTVYAVKDGAVAAPTAGLHITSQLLEGIQKRGVRVESVTLHVGYGTFAPLTVDDLADHRMHAEFYELDAGVADRLRESRTRGGRVIAVGTTAARVLETVHACGDGAGRLSGWTDLFCYPPYSFGLVDGLLTNFHLPRSTLMALVMAFAGVDVIRRAYAHAIEKRYRFYSYGDAMLIM